MEIQIYIISSFDKTIFLNNLNIQINNICNIIKNFVI